MAKQKREPITSKEAIDSYYGGIQKLQSSALPLKCRCGGEVWTSEDLLKHVKLEHKEKITRT